MVFFHNKELTCHREKGGVAMDTSDLKKILAGIAVTSLLAGATLSVGGCRGNSS
jgi:radical SAM modification target selenobiotic family peptide